MAGYIGSKSSVTQVPSSIKDNGTSTAITIDSNENVGIGTISPTRQLDVSKAGTAYIRASDTANSVNMDMLAASSGGWIGTQTNHSLMFQTNNAERLRIDSDGLKFNGDTAAANALNDYEEGTCTLTLSSTGTAPTITQGNDFTAAYCRVGNTCTVHAYTGLRGITSAGTGISKLTGLPFNVKTGYYAQPVLSHNTMFPTTVSGYVEAGQNVIYPIPTGSLAGSTYATGNVYMMFSLTYVTND